MTYIAYVNINTYTALYRTTSSAAKIAYKDVTKSERNKALFGTSHAHA